MKPFVFDIKTTAEEAFSALQTQPYSLWLDSADTGHPQGRFSYIVSHPVEMIEAKDGRVTVTNNAQQTVLRCDPFEILNERLAAWKSEAETIEDLPPFQGGLAGFFGYDLARSIENLPASTRLNPHMPDMAIGIYDRVIAFDHRKNKAWLIIHAESKSEAERKRTVLLHILKHKRTEAKENPVLNWSPAELAESYKEKIKRVIKYITAGDIFQANLSQRFEAVLPPSFDRFSHYLTMRKVNPAPFAAYMNLGGIVISSASPEQFLSVQDNKVTTRPIKGTRPRGRDKKEDEKNREELAHSPKDRAENIMIVDLLRSDLSKVCKPASIQLTELCKLETFAGVHHLVSTVEGTLTKTPVDLIRACFPGGSITGAPKIRSMEIIEELETARRGPYCGAMAWIGFNGAMDSNILIRTLVYQGNKVTLQTGGGITAGSDAEEEYRETLAKAEKIFRSFDASVQKKTGSA
ncbi:MAG: aminodeoxychorismate synthase component I [Alphaproteobacteria bacterium PRO2]|nr:aminodeoxychorismate synthase component I [Alphaproteobacteria bacterium PRO2]